MQAQRAWSSQSHDHSSFTAPASLRELAQLQHGSMQHQTIRQRADWSALEPSPTASLLVCSPFRAWFPSCKPSVTTPTLCRHASTKDCLVQLCTLLLQAQHHTRPATGRHERSIRVALHSPLRAPACARDPYLPLGPLVHARQTSPPC